MDPESNQSDPDARQPRTVLPPRRRGPPPELGPVPEADGAAQAGHDPQPGAPRPVAPGTVAGREASDAPAAVAGWEADPTDGPVPPGTPQRLPRKRSTLGVVIFSVVVPLSMFALVVYFVIRLDERKKRTETVPGGVIHRMSDGLIAVQNDPNSGKKVYYLVLAPREAEPHIEFGERTMTVVVRTDGGLRDLSRSVDWEEAPYAMLIKYLDFYGPTPRFPCPPGMVEGYLERAGKEGRVAPLAVQIEQPALITP